MNVRDRKCYLFEIILSEITDWIWASKGEMIDTYHRHDKVSRENVSRRLVSNEDGVPSPLECLALHFKCNILPTMNQRRSITAGQGARVPQI